MKRYIIINKPLKILNAHREVVYFFHAGERVEVEATTEYYWVTRHGAVWFSQAREEPIVSGVFLLLVVA